MIVRQALSHARNVFDYAGIEDPYFEAELLLRHALKIDRVELYQELNCVLSTVQDEEFQRLIERRLNNEPAAYIIGHREFYGLDFTVNPDVLIPRPESEMLVGKAIELVHNHCLSTVADIGTGCGAIAISLAINLPDSVIFATDISASALRVAFSNCRKHGVTDRVELLQGDLLDPLPGPVDLIIANLPYVREPELCAVNTVNFEPILALNGGADGLDTIRRLCLQTGKKLCPGGYLLLEVGQGQGESVTDFLRSLYSSAEVELMPDLSGIGRVVSLLLSE